MYKSLHSLKTDTIVARTNIAIDQSVADELAVQAAKENKTLYAFANESLLSVLDVAKAGGTPRQVQPAWKFVRMMKDVDCVALPGDLIEKLISRLHSIDKDWLFKTWQDEGARLGEYLRMSAVNPEDLGEIIDEFQLLLPAHRIEFRKKQEGTNTQFVIRAVGAGHSLESTKCAEQFIRGVLLPYSLKVVESNVAKGIIELKASSA
jgi:hypothetical protein